MKEVLGFLFYNFRIVVGVGWPVPSQAEQHETPESNLIVVVVVIVAVRMGGGKREEEWGREREKTQSPIKKRNKNQMERMWRKKIDGCDDGFRYNRTFLQHPTIVHLLSLPSEQDIDIMERFFGRRERKIKGKAFFGGTFKK